MFARWRVVHRVGASRLGAPAAGGRVLAVTLDERPGRDDDGAAREQRHARVLLRHQLVAGDGTDRALRQRVRKGELEHVHRGAYLAGTDGLHDEERFRLRVMAYVRQRRAEGGDPVLAGPAAVVVLGLPLWGRTPATIHVTQAGRGGRALRGLATPVAAAPGGQVVSRDGVRVVAPARSVLDTARLASLVAGVVAADAALRRRQCSRAELGEAVRDLKGHKGVARARTCQALADPLSESPGESWSAVVLHLHGVPAPRRQQVFADAAGSIGRTDFWWPDHGVVGEFDGRVKYGRVDGSSRSAGDVLWAEKVREDRLRALGLRVVRWTAADLRGPESLCARLHRILR